MSYCPPDKPNLERERLAVLARYQILDTPSEQEYDDLTRLAALICEAPAAALTFLDAERQWFKSCLGLTLQQTPRAVAFCDYTIRGTDPLVVEDATRDPRFAQNPLVVEPPHVRAYLGIPLLVDEVIAIGALTVMDHQPRPWGQQQIDALQIMARQVVSQLDLRLLHREQTNLLQTQATTEAQLRRSEEQYRLLFTNNPHPMWVYDQETLRILNVNDAAIQHYGYTRDDFLTMTLRDFRPAQDVPQLDRRVATLDGKPSSGIWRHIKKDGTVIDVEVSSDALTYNGRPARLVMAVDITHHRQLAARLRQQAALLEIAHDAIIVRDLDDRISFWNPSAQRLYGWHADEAIGHSARDLLHPDSDAYDEAKAQLLANGSWTGRVTKRHRSGEEIVVECSWTLVYDDDEQPAAVLAINTDVTERTQLQAQILRAQRMESIGTLAGGIAHDLNNVLAPMLLAVGMLRQRADNEKDQRLLDMLEKNAQRGAEMVRQVLTFARGAQGDRVQINLEQNIQELERLIRDTFDRRIHVVSAIAPNLWPVIGDPTQIHQVLLNLCVNARDAMPLGGVLELKAANLTIDAQYASMNPEAKPGNYVQLTVADTGGGIPPAIRERIFDPFFTTKETGRGTGLGLSTVQALVKSHGGFITLYSEEERGTIFHVYLPAAGIDTPLQSLDLDTDLPHGQGQLILVVDDEHAVRTVIQETLESFGYRVVSAEDGASALSLYVQHAPNVALVLTDMMMPIMDGYALIQSLYKINPDLEIIATSGLTANGMVAKAVAAGVKYFLQKPYTAEAMLNKVAQALGASPPAQEDAR